MLRGRPINAKRNASSGANPITGGLPEVKSNPVSIQVPLYSSGSRYKYPVA